MTELSRGTLCKPGTRPGRLFVYLTSGVLAIAAAMAPPTVRVALAQDARPVEEVVTIGTRGTTEKKKFRQFQKQPAGMMLYSA